MRLPDRKLMRILFQVLIAATLTGAAARGATLTPLFARGYTVLPAPQQVDLKSEDFQFGNAWRLQLRAGVKADGVAVQSLKSELSTRYGITLESAARASRKSGKVIALEIQPGSVKIGQATDKNKSALEEQAYKLELASDGIRITANAGTGLLYGVDTLVQLVKRDGGKWLLPNATITDWPDLEQRNIYWDDNHHLDHIDVLKAALRQAAFYKINGFAIKLNGHFQYQSAPAVVEPYALTPEQLQDLTNYGLKYHVQLIPYLDAPAHIAFILKHPEYAGLREYPDSNYELCTTNPDSYKLLDGMYQNLLDANKGVKYFVLSTDEPYYVGLADNDQCKEGQRAKELGSAGKMLAEFLTKAAGYLHDRGRTVIFWGEYPMIPSDIPSLPSHLVNGEVYGPAFDEAFKAHGIKQMIYVSTQSGPNPLFPAYYLLPSSEWVSPIRPRASLDQIYTHVSFSPARQHADLIGMFNAGWGDEGLHPETFWLGYAAGTAYGWNAGTPDPSEAMSSFYHLFYGEGAADMGRLYQLMSTQAQFWNSSWDREPSSSRKPIFGSSNQIYKVRHPAHDQTLPLPPVPQGEYLRLPFDWSAQNAHRVQMAREQRPAEDELLDLLHRNLGSVQFHHYNLQVYTSIAGLYRQNLDMIDGLSQIDRSLKAAQTAAAEVQFSDALASLDQALDLAKQIREERNEALGNTVAVWYQSWYPRVEEANGRRYLDAIDDVKDHLPVRTVDMSYLINREMILPLGQWFDQVEAVRNKYAEAHHLPSRTDNLDWKQTQTPAAK